MEKSQVGGFISNGQVRRSGQSTRQIDLAIQIIFTTKEGWKSRDHYEFGVNRQANKLLFERVIKRLASEHGLNRLIEEKLILIDNREFTIKLV